MGTKNISSSSARAFRHFGVFISPHSNLVKTENGDFAVIGERRDVFAIFDWAMPYLGISRRCRSYGVDRPCRRAIAPTGGIHFNLAVDFRDSAKSSRIFAPRRPTATCHQKTSRSQHALLLSQIARLVKTRTWASRSLSSGRPKGRTRSLSPPDACSRAPANGEAVKRSVPAGAARIGLAAAAGRPARGMRCVPSVRWRIVAQAPAVDMHEHR